MAVKQEAMSGPPTRVLADDVAPRVDTDSHGGRGARDVNRREAAMAVEQEAMSSARSSVLANDVTLGVDTEGYGG